ncbi:MAG: glutamyl-tRNA reductase [Campylobacter sp.]|nr:glutamyl-tRNA reductase [Campylobacter sp.]
MDYLSISFTHKNTDISVREKLAFDKPKQKELLKLVCSNQSISECLLLSTCNRVEILALVKELDLSKNYIIKVISILSGLELSELEYRADVFYGSGAVHHIFSVASSLDSLVIGETQIAGQLKEALNFALEENFAKDSLKRLVEYSFKCAAEVRNKTEISKNPVSVSSVAVTKAKEILGNLNSIDAVVVGAGHMSELACRHLISNGAKITLVNRSEKRAFKLMDNLSSQVKFEPFSNLKEVINSHKLIFTSTAAPNVIIDDDMIKNVNFERYFFDIAVPRDIDIKESSKVKLFSVDDLQEIVKQNLVLREEQAQEAYAIVGRYTSDFYKWLKSLATTPIIKALRGLAKDIADEQIAKALEKGYLKSCDEGEVRRLVDQVFRAFLHTPTINLKDIGSDKDTANTLEAIMNVFDITDDFKKYSKGLKK